MTVEPSTSDTGTPSTPPRRGAAAGIVALGVLVGGGLGVGAHVLAPTDFGESPIDILDAPHPTPSPTDTGLLATLDWHPSPGPAPDIEGWSPDAEPGWPGVALDAGDLWMLESVSASGSGEIAALYLVGPGGSRIGLMELPEGARAVAGWDHDAGLAYTTGSEGPIVIDLATYRWAYIPVGPEWGVGSDDEVEVSLIGTAASGEVIWHTGGDPMELGTWDPVDGWDMGSVDVSGGTVWWGPQVPSDWLTVVDWTGETIVMVDAVTHEQVVLPGTLEDWNTGYMEFGMTWLDGDTVARPPRDGSDWLAFDAPTFDSGRAIGPEDLPIGLQQRREWAQYPGTPLIAQGVNDGSEYRVTALGVLTTDGLQELVDFSGEDAPSLPLWVWPIEYRPGLYVFDYWEGYDGILLVVDVVEGKVYDYGVAANYSADDGLYLIVHHVIYVEPEDETTADE